MRWLVVFLLAVLAAGLTGPAAPRFLPLRQPWAAGPSPPAGPAAPAPLRMAAAYAGHGVPPTWRAARAALLSAAPDQQQELVTAWDELLQRQGTPLIEAELVHFFYFGQAQEVALAGDWTNWQPARLERVAGTDLWVRAEPLRRDAVLPYRFLVDGRSQPDERNPRVSTALNTSWSIYLGPDAPGDEPPRQRASGERQELTIPSAALGRTVTVEVHVPPDCSDQSPCPVLYVADGPFYLDEGHLLQTAFALTSAGRLPPLVVVGIVPELNPIMRTLELLPGLRGDAWPRFLRTELAPAVEAAFPVRQDRMGRALLGQSAGAAAMLQAVLLQPEQWGRALIQSPAALPPILGDAAAAFSGPRVRLWLTWGQYEQNIFGLDVAGDAANVAAHLHTRGMELGGGERPSGHTMAFWRRDLAEALVWTYTAAPPD